MTLTAKQIRALILHEAEQISVSALSKVELLASIKRLEELTKLLPDDIEK